jgi:hypothetical protein
LNDSEIFKEIVSLDELSIDQAPTHAILSDGISRLDVLQICSPSGISHVVQKSNLKLDCETRLTRVMLESPMDFVNFPLSSILSDSAPTWESENNLRHIQIEFDSAAMKESALEQLQEYAKRFSNPPSVVCDMTVAADELITNAIYDAPYVDFGNTHSGPDRNKDLISIDAEKRPVFLQVLTRLGSS